MSRNSANDYIDPAEFHREMVEFKEKNKHLRKDEAPVIPDKIARKLMLICENHSRYRQFYWRSYRDEMVADAIEKCVRKIMKYDHERFSNPFSYFSQIAYYAFVNRIQKEEGEKTNRARFSREETCRIYEQTVSDAPEGSQDKFRMDQVLEGMFSKMDEEMMEIEKGKAEAKKHPKKTRTTLYHQKRQKEKDEEESSSS